MGFDIFGRNNTVTWEDVQSFDNKEQGFEVDGDANTITIKDSFLIDNGSSGFSFDYTERE